MASEHLLGLKEKSQ